MFNYHYFDGVIKRKVFLVSFVIITLTPFVTNLKSLEPGFLPVDFLNGSQRTTLFWMPISYIIAILILQQWQLSFYRSSHSHMFFKIGVLNTCVWVSFFSKVADLSSVTSLKSLQHRCFPLNIACGPSFVKKNLLHTSKCLHFKSNCY